MIKKQLKFLISIMVIAILLANVSSCFATEADPTATAEEPTTTAAPETNDVSVSEDTSTENTTNEVDTSASEANKEITDTTIIEEDVYRADAKDAIIKNPIDSNVFTVSKNVTITNEVGNDVFVTANSFTLAETSIVYGNLFVCAQDVTINGTVYGNVYVVSQSLHLGATSQFAKDIKACSKDVTFEGKVGRNVDIACDTLSFPTADDLLIYGKLNYTASQEVSADILSKVVKGETKFTPAEKMSTSQAVADTVLSTIATLLYVLVVVLVAKKLLPKFAEYSNKMSVKSVLLKVLFGFATLILIPIVAILLMITRIGSAIGVMLIALYVLTIALSFPLFVMMVSSFINGKVKSDKKIVEIGIILGTALVAKLLELIPVIGGIFSFIFLLVGLGMIVDYLTAKKPSTEKTTTVESKE